MKVLACLILGAVLAGCTNSYSENPPVAMPPELSDCKFYRIYRAGTATLNVVRCPNSSTSTNWTVSGGKSGSSYYNTVVIDGVQHREVKK